MGRYLRMGGAVRSRRALAPLLALVALSCSHAAPEILPDAGNEKPKILTPQGEVVQPFDPHFATITTEPDDRSDAEIAAAACTSALDTGWRCKKAGKPVLAMAWPRKKKLGATTLGASSGSTAIIPASWTVPHWFVDTTNSSAAASDFNSCTSAAAPCLTWQEIASHRMGCANSRGCVRLRQTTDVRFMSSQSGTTDPVYADFAIENSGSFTIFANLPTPTVSSTFTNNLQFTGCNTPNVRDTVSGVFPTGAFVQDVTVGANFFCDEFGGGATICQQTVGMTAVSAPPTTLQTPGLWGTLTGAAGTIGSTDTYHSYSNLVAVDLVEADPVMADYSAATPANGVFLYHINVLDPSGTPGTSPIKWGPNVVGYESRIDRYLNLTTDDSTKEDGCVNCFINGNLTGGRFATGHYFHVLGGELTTNSGNINVTGLGLALDGYVLFEGTANFVQGASLGLFHNPFSTVTFGGYTTLSAITPGYASVNNGVAICMSSTTLNVNGNGSFRYDSSHGGLTGITTGSGTWEINGSTTAESHSGTGTVTVTNGISINPTNMDAAASSTAFGGAAFWKGAFLGSL